MATSIGLPEGFIIDQPEQPAGLPAGFVIDEPEIALAPEAIETPSDARMLGTLAEKARGVGEFLGLEKATDPFMRTLARAVTPEEEYGVSATPEEREAAIPEPSAAELMGAGLQIGALFIPYGKIAGALKTGFGKLAPEAIAKALSAAGAGAVGGYAIEAGEKIQRGEAPTPGLTTAIGAVAPVALPAVARKLLPKPIDLALKRNIKEGISKGIRPSVPTVGKTASQREAYYGKAQDAVESIVGNKANLQFTDEFGASVQGKLPENLNQFSDAIAQTKKTIFTQYDDLAQRAGKKGATVELSSVAKELSDVTKDKVLSDLDPEIIKYANARARTLTARGQYTTAEAQNAITKLNASLESFYKNPSYDTASRAHIDALIANNLRKNLDDVIERTTEKGYQALKKQYGALKSIEKDTTRRAIVDARKNIRGLVDFSDILSGAGAVHGLVGLNPATLASAATAKGLAAWTKRLNDPNRIIGNMFKKSEKLIERGIRQAGRKPMSKPRFPGDVALSGIKKATPLARRKLSEQRGSISLKKYNNLADFKKDTGVKLFHGTDKVFKEFDVTKAADGTIWFTDKVEDITSPAIGVAATGKGRIIKRILPKNLKLADEDLIDKFSVDELINQGYDGVKYAPGDIEGAWYQIFHPEKLSK